MNKEEYDQILTKKNLLIQGLQTVKQTRPRDFMKVINLASTAAELELQVAKHHMDNSEPRNALISLISVADLTRDVIHPEEKPLQLEIHIDDQPTDPHEWDGQWTLHGFNSSKVHYTHPDGHGITRAGESTIKGIQKKLDDGLAFIVSYYEHGDCVWFIKGRGMPGTDCQFDSTTVAGVLIWENNENDMGARTYEDRTKDAEGFLKEYTAWCNGHVYGYTLESPEGAAQCDDPVASCYGYYDLEHMFEEIRSYVDGREVEVNGDLASLADGVDFSIPVKEDETAGATT